MSNTKIEQTEVSTIIHQEHYNDKYGSLYLVAIQRGWNAYQFDAIKRIDRCEKKGEFEKDIDKTIEVLKMYKHKQ